MRACTRSSSSMQQTRQRTPSRPAARSSTRLHVRALAEQQSIRGDVCSNYVLAEGMRQVLDEVVVVVVVGEAAVRQACVLAAGASGGRRRMHAAGDGSGGGGRSDSCPISVRVSGVRRSAPRAVVDVTERYVAARVAAAVACVVEVAGWCGGLVRGEVVRDALAAPVTLTAPVRWQWWWWWKRSVCGECERQRWREAIKEHLSYASCACDGVSGPCAVRGSTVRCCMMCALSVGECGPHMHVHPLRRRALQVYTLKDARLAAQYSILAHGGERRPGARS